MVDALSLVYTSTKAPSQRNANSASTSSFSPSIFSRDFPSLLSSSQAALFSFFHLLNPRVVLARGHIQLFVPLNLYLVCAIIEPG